MCLKNSTITYIEKYSKQIDRLKNEVKTADAIVIGAGIYIITAMPVSYTHLYADHRYQRTQ